jgi:hypothetical protein
MLLGDFYPGNIPADIQQAYQDTIYIDKNTDAAVFNRQNAALRFAFQVKKVDPENGKVTQTGREEWTVTMSND